MQEVKKKGLERCFAGCKIQHRREGHRRLQTEQLAGYMLEETRWLQDGRLGGRGRVEAVVDVHFSSLLVGGLRLEIRSWVFERKVLSVRVYVV